jgi:hypothetical protein
MKQISIIVLAVFLTVILTLSGCTETEYTTGADMITATVDASVVLVERGAETLQIEGSGEFYYKEWGDLPQTFHGVAIDNSLYPYTEGETPIGVNYYSYSFEFEDGAINYITWARYALDTTTTADGTNIYLTEHISPQAGIMRVVSDGRWQSYMLVSTN